MKFLNKIITYAVNFLVYSNLWIAFGAVCMTILSIQQLNFPAYPSTKLLFFIGSATIVIYQLARLVGLKSMSPASRSKLQAKKQEIALLISVFVCSGVTLTLFWSLTFYQQLLMLISGLISVLYTFPLVPYKQSYSRLRDVNGLKIGLIALIWMASTVLLPLLQATNHWNALYVPIILLCIERFLFIFAITLPFDIRDVKYDVEQDLQTIPISLGIEKTKQLAHGLLVACMLLQFIIFFMIDGNVILLISTFLVYLLAILLVSNATTQQTDKYYTALIDGLLVLHFPLYFLVRCLY